MNAGNGQTVRKIPVAPVLVPEVLVRIRRDADGGMLRWSLGDHGGCELGVPRPATGPGETSLLAETGGRIHAPDGVGSGLLTVTVHALDDQSCEVFLDVVSLAGRWFDEQPAAFAALRRAALRELAEDLRYHAARAASLAVDRGVDAA